MSEELWQFSVPFLNFLLGFRDSRPLIFLGLLLTSSPSHSFVLGFILIGGFGARRGAAVQLLREPKVARSSRRIILCLGPLWRALLTRRFHASAGS